MTSSSCNRQIHISLRRHSITTIFIILMLINLCNGDTHICDANNVCPSIINCQSNEDCIIICSADSSCKDRLINCTSNHACIVHCINPFGHSQCENLIIYANTSSSLFVNASLGDAALPPFNNPDPNTMDNAVIYCPQNGPFTSTDDIVCVINCNGDDLLRGTTIYAHEGFNDVTITATHYQMSWCYRSGLMNCKVEFDAVCPIQSDSDPPFRCSAVSTDTTCDDYRVTPSPTRSPINSVSPSMIPTNSPMYPPSDFPTIDPTGFPIATYRPSESPIKPGAPTKIPTFSTESPTKHPTTGPTQEATEEPTVDPTAYPTTNPTTSNPTVSPTSVQIMCGKHYVGYSANEQIEVNITFDAETVVFRTCTTDEITSFDTVLELYNSSKSLIGRADDGCEGNEYDGLSKLTMYQLNAGKYFLNLKSKWSDVNRPRWLVEILCDTTSNPTLEPTLSPVSITTSFPTIHSTSDLQTSKPTFVDTVKPTSIMSNSMDTPTISSVNTNIIIAVVLVSVVLLAALTCIVHVYICKKRRQNPQRDEQLELAEIAQNNNHIMQLNERDSVDEDHKMDEDIPGQLRANPNEINSDNESQNERLIRHSQVEGHEQNLPNDAYSTPYI